MAASNVMKFRRIALLIVVVLATILGRNPQYAFWHLVTVAFSVYHNGVLVVNFLYYQKITHSCFEDSPWTLWAWENFEAIAASQPPYPAEPVPVIEVTAPPGVADDWTSREQRACKRIVDDFGGWGTRPFVVRGLLDGTDVLTDRDSWSLAWLAKNAGDKPMHVIDVSYYREHWEEMRNCPWKRFSARRTSTVSDIVSQMNSTSPGSRWYVNFAETFFGDVDTLGREPRTAESAYMRHMAGTDHIWKLCAGRNVSGRSFNGFGGEVFFGASDDDNEAAPVGTPVHAAYMRNFFLQLRGQRYWRLWSPSYSQLMRAEGTMGYVTGVGAHKTWDVKSERQADGLNATYVSHLHSVPSMFVEMQPGDLLYVPPWWLHDTRVKGGYSLGISARGTDWSDGASESWFDLPVLRWLKDWNGLDALVFDIFQTLPLGASDPLRAARAGFVEKRLHGPKIEAD